MTGVLAVVTVTLVAVLALVLVQQRRLANRLLLAGRRLAEDVVPTGNGLAEATSVVERVVDRAVARGGDVSLAEARLASALARVPQGVVVFDAGGNIAFRNKVAATYLAARHGEALVAEAIGEVADAVAGSTGSVGPTKTIELFGPPRRVLVLRGVSLERSADDLGALVLIDDVTDRRRLEAVRRDFVANISHELKTPVGALVLLAETLLDEPDPGVAGRLAERMLEEAMRVASTIDDLLELSRIEVDDTPVRDEIGLSDVVDEAVGRVAGAAEQRRITIESEPADGVSILGDRRQLVSAAYNLLDNAVKYSDDGSTIRIAARADGAWAELTVADQGIGIPRRDLERVFERFYRVDPARSRDTGGTGLGLAIVRHVAANHGGEVLVESREGDGSVFTLRLPRQGGRSPAAADGA